MLLTVKCPVRRWKLWVRRLQEDLRLGQQYDAKAWHAEVMAFTLQWARGNDSLPVHPCGDAVETSMALCRKWRVCSDRRKQPKTTLPSADTR